MDGKREKRGKERQREACTSVQLSKDWPFLLEPGMPLGCQKPLGSAFCENAPCRGSGWISPTCLLSGPYAVNALCICAQLLVCFCDVEGTPWSSVPQTCTDPEVPLLNDPSVGSPGL